MRSFAAIRPSAVQHDPSTRWKHLPICLLLLYLTTGISQKTESIPEVWNDPFPGETR
jgi:hypothetical protein